MQCEEKSYDQLILEFKKLKNETYKINQELQQRIETLRRLANSPERFWRFIELSSDAFLLEDRQGIIIAANQQLTELSGYLIRELIGKNVALLFPDNDPEKLSLQQAQLKNEGDALVIERSLLSKSGATIPVDVSITRLANGNLQSFITDRSHPQTARQKHNACSCPHLKLLENAPIGIFTTNSKGQVCSINRAMAQILGFSSQDEALSNCTDLKRQLYLHSHRRDDLLCLLKEHSFVQNFEFEARTKKGSVIWLNITANITEQKNGDDFTITGFASDITERKKIEERQGLLLSAIEQTSETILITNQEGDISYVNPAFESVTGYSREEVLGRNPRILKSGKQPETFYQNMWHTLTSGKSWQGRFINKRKDGTLYTEEADISPIFNSAGTIIHYVATKLDITEEIKREEHYRQAQKMEDIGQLAGGVAHDFNNMLGVILGRTELGLRTLDVADPLYATLEEIKSAAQRSTNLTRQLLAYARKQTIEPIVFDLNPAVDDILTLLRQLAGERIKLIWKPGAHSCQIKIDPSQLDQILTNLTVNARDAIGDDGIIVIETGEVILDQIYCDHHPGFIPGKYVLLTVSDNGKGMDRETLAKVFEPFFTTKTLHQGTGLGLATVYGTIKQNRGFINVYSEPGIGTTFKVFLPKVNEEGVSIPIKSAEQIQQGHGETVLLVEDESALLKMEEKMLQELGYVVIIAHSAQEALDLAEEKIDKIDLLITDLIMPGMNGRILADHLLKLKQDLKVLFMSGYTANIISHQEILDENINFIHKPFLMDELSEKIKITLG